ncbi:MAG: S8 family serine peptidase [Myxococcota bacterium]
MRFADDADPTEVVARHGARLLRPPGRSGYALIGGSATALDAVSADPRTRTSLPHATTTGSGNVRNRVRPLENHQWYIDEIDPPLPGAFHHRSQAFDFVQPLSTFVVAVLDTGVAYGPNGAPGLTSSPIVAPYDFVNDDAEAHDDHQHGTHIASLIAADGEHGAIEGIAPAVGIMPVKVLNADNRGIEIDLVEGIHHAVANGADIINMSLSFGEGYRPSIALLEALQAAHDAGVIMVGAAGNAGSDYITWPAASPLVIAVGASAKKSGHNRYENRGPADYTNLGAGLDVMTSGGDLSRSGLVSGLPNGILAEGITPGNPDQVGHWLMAGTSQAAAVVSGLAAGLLAGDVAPERVAAALQGHSRVRGISARDLHLAGEGAGYLDLNWGRSLDPKEVYKPLPSDGQRYDPLETFHVAVLPYLKAVGTDEVQAVARIKAFQEDGSPANGVRVLASLYGSDTGIVHCYTDSAGVCTLEGKALPEFDEAGNPVPHAVAFSVEKVLYDNDQRHSHPRVAMTTSPGLDALVDALAEDSQTNNALLAWSFDRVHDDELGALAPAFSVVDNGGSGLVSIPLGLVMSPPMVDQLGTIEPGTVTASGHELPVQMVHLDGSGLRSLPLGFLDVRIVTLDGVGLASLPLGVRALVAHGDGPSVLPVDQLVGSAAKTTLAEHLCNGGFSLQGYGAASILSSSSEVAIAPSFVAGLTGLGAGAVILDPVVEAAAATAPPVPPVSEVDEPTVAEPQE